MEGTFTIKAVAHKLGRAGTGTDQIGVACRIIGGAHDGQMHTWYGFFTQDTVDRTLESLRCFGWHGTDITNLTRDGFGTELAQGVFGEEEQPGTGAVVTRLKWINSAGVAMKDVLGTDDAKALARRVSTYIDRGKAAPMRPPSSGSQSLPATGGDDDIPF